MKTLFRFLLAVVLLSSCKKNAPDTPSLPLAGDFAGTYTSATVAQVSTKLITQKGISTDAAAIKSALSGSTANMSLVETTTVDPGLLNLTVLANGEADIDIFAGALRPGRVTFKGTIGDITADELIVRSAKTDTTFMYFYVPGTSMAKPIGPEDKFIPLSSATGYYNSGYLIGPKRQRLIHKGTDLYLPMMVYFYRYNSATAVGWEFIGPYSIFNIVDPARQQLLGPDDQLVVQEMLIRLVKK